MAPPPGDRADPPREEEADGLALSGQLERLEIGGKARAPMRRKPRRPQARGGPLRAKPKEEESKRQVRSLAADCGRLRISGGGGGGGEAPTCSSQALNPPPAVAPRDDITMDELASYFENYVHIPRKMTTMAEMMYT